MKKEQSISVKELYIGIGSNLHDPKKQVNAAIQKLLEQDEFNDLKVSKLNELPCVANFLMSVLMISNDILDNPFFSSPIEIS